ncbi:ATP-dependent Clp protease proteolytic subunit [Rhodobacteraceae bacterium NNCM2]|nr:ATP-dependent Clp protease proteolytic subunit [Coraliihabitans acroporae]
MNQVIASYRPFPMADRIERHRFDIGTRLSEIVKSFRLKGEVEVRIGSRVVPEEAWSQIEPGQPVTIIGVPTGPAVALIPAIAAVAAGAGATAAAGGAAAIVTTALGGLITITGATVGAIVSEVEGPPSTTEQGDGVSPPMPDDATTWINIQGPIRHRNCVRKFSEMLAKEPGPVCVTINSRGGSTAEALEIYDLFKTHPYPVHVRIRGNAMSAAAIIAMAGDTICIEPGSRFMLHETTVPATTESANVKRLREILEIMEAMEARSRRLFADRTGLTEDQIQDLLDKRIYLSAEQTVKLGFADWVAS